VNVYHGSAVATEFSGSMVWRQDILSDKKLQLNSEWEQARGPIPSRYQKKKKISEVVSVP
jgi:hypothetical protein